MDYARTDLDALLNCLHVQISSQYTKTVDATVWGAFQDRVVLNLHYFLQRNNNILIDYQDPE